MTFPSLENFRTANIAGWISSYTFTTIIWWVSVSPESHFCHRPPPARSVRLSLLYSIVRVGLPSSLLRNLMHVIGAIFVIIWASLVGLKTWWCVDNMESALGLPRCHLSDSIAIFEVTSECPAVSFGQMLTF